MSSSPDHLFMLKSPSRKRSHAPGGDLRTPKRRRSSLSFGLVLRTELAPVAESKTVQSDSRDRFLPTLTTTEPFYHLNNMTPRSARLARALGLIQPRLLSFRDDTPDLLAHRLSDPTFPTRTRLSQSLVSETPTPIPTHSAIRHGRMKPDRVLNSGPMNEFALHPCAWSAKNVIAAVIRNCVFTHDMNTNAISNLVNHDGLATCVEWTADNELAIGHDWGGIILFEMGTRTARKYILPRISATEARSAGPKTSKVKAMSWSTQQGMLAVGRMNGEISYFDPRQDKPVRNDPGDELCPVLGVKWSPDGMFLASGYKGGIVRCMDWTANKTFDLGLAHGKTAHKAAVKSLAWAPWDPRLLATGGGIADHTVRIWSLAGCNTFSQGPLHTLPFSSGISSLHFSPHTTELLSTHGAPAPPEPHSRSGSLLHSRRRPSLAASAAATQAAATRHALLVHTYPSLKRVHAVPNAHARPIVDSVLAPDGTRVMTFGEDETLRVWTVWGEREEVRTVSLMDRYRIR